MTHRIARLVLMYLLLGLAAAWMAAWASALLVRIPSGQTWAYERAGPPHRVIALSEGLGGRSYELKQCVSSETMAFVSTSVNRTNLTLEFDYSLPPIASRLASLDARGLTSRTIEIVARGWPWPAAYSDVLLSQAGFNAIMASPEEEYWGTSAQTGTGAGATAPLFQSRGALVMRSKLLGGANDKMSAVLLPYVPSWPGLLADALVFAAILAAIHQFAAASRRWRRRRARRCEACAYDLTGITGPCPECGKEP